MKPTLKAFHCNVFVQSPVLKTKPYAIKDLPPGTFFRHKDRFDGTSSKLQIGLRRLNDYQFLCDSRGSPWYAAHEFSESTSSCWVPITNLEALGQIKRFKKPKPANVVQMSLEDILPPMEQ